MAKNDSKGGYSREGLFGDIIHYDSKGHKIGESRLSFWGGYNNYDAKGHKVGESRPGFLGYNTYDNKGHKIGSTTEGFFGTTHHYDAKGHRSGSSREAFSLDPTAQVHESTGDLATRINQAGSAAGLRQNRNYQTVIGITAGAAAARARDMKGDNILGIPADTRGDNVHYKMGAIEDNSPQRIPIVDEEPDEILRYLIAWQGPGYHKTYIYSDDPSIAVGDYIIPEYPPVAMRY